MSRLARCLGALLLMTAVARAADLVVLIQDGAPAVSLVLPAEPAAAIKLAAKELTDHLAQISGATLAQGTAPIAGLVPIYLGPAAAPELAQQLTVADSFVLRVAPGRIDLAGLGEGPLFAAYELLEQLGVRWFMPGELGTVIPTAKTVALPVQSTQQAPSFPGRHFQMPHVDWQTRLRCGGPNFPSAHGLPGLNPRNAEDKLFVAHPEWFSLVKGKRTPRQHCVSNPELLAAAIANTREFFRKHPTVATMGIGPNDGSGFCECEPCRALDAGDFDAFSGEPSVTDRYIWFFNRVLDGIQDEFPDKKVGFYIYHTYMRPPVREKPNPRVTGALAVIALCRIHGPANPICPEKQYYQWLATEWGKLMPELWDRGYWSNLACPGFPFVIIDRLRTEIPLGKQAGLFGWRVETFPHWGTQLPSMYVAGKLMWNHQADVDALLQDFADRFYGAAAQPMLAYTKLMDGALRDGDFHTGCSWDFHLLYPAELRQRGKALLDQAAKLAPADSLYARRVAMTRQTFDLLEAFIAMMEARVRADFVAAQEALTRQDALAQQLLAYDPPMIGKTMYESYMKRFYRPCTEQGYARVSGGNRLLAATQDEWQAQVDPQKVGFDLGYHRPELTGPNWQPLKTASHSFSSQGMRYYKGLVWYRQTVTLPADAAGQRVFLWCGGVDELAKVWLNGQPLGISHGGAFYPFEVDATAAVQAGKPNTIVIAVSNERVNELGTGGLVAPILLYVPKDGADAKLENMRDLKPTFP